MHLMRILVAIVTTFLVTGCRTTALIHKKDGTVIEGDIRRSDKSTIFVVPSKPSERNVVEPSRIPERTNGTIIPEIMDECVADRTVKCKQRCRNGFPSDYSKDIALKCMKSCPDHDTAKSQCESISVEIPIARADIDDIEHPGETHTLVGMSLTLAGIGGLVVASYISQNCGKGIEDHNPGCTDNEMAGVLAGGLVMIAGIISLPVWIWGTIVWAGSSSAAVPPRRPRGPKIRPVAISDGERSYYGLGLIWIW